MVHEDLRPCVINGLPASLRLRPVNTHRYISADRGCHFNSSRDRHTCSPNRSYFGICAHPNSDSKGHACPHGHINALPHSHTDRTGSHARSGPLATNGDASRERDDPNPNTRLRSNANSDPDSHPHTDSYSKSGTRVSN